MPLKREEAINPPTGKWCSSFCKRNREKKNCSSFLHLTSSCCTQLNKLKTLLARKILYFYDRQTSSCLRSPPPHQNSTYELFVCMCVCVCSMAFTQFSTIFSTLDARSRYSNVCGSLKESSSCVCVCTLKKVTRFMMPFALFTTSR